MSETSKAIPPAPAPTPESPAPLTAEVHLATLRAALDRTEQRERKALGKLTRAARHYRACRRRVIEARRAFLGQTGQAANRKDGMR